MELFLNRVWATLASGIDEVQTDLYLSTGHGARFGTIGAGDKVRIVLLDAAANVSEVMYATGRTGDTLTVDRAQDGTTAVVHIAGDRLEHRIGKSTMDAITQKEKAGTDAAAEMHAAASKATPVDADEFFLADSAATFGLKRLTWANIKATLLTTWKDVTGGLVGMTLYKINFKNAANTFTSFFTNSNTAARTYTFKDRDGIIIDDTDYDYIDSILTALGTGSSNDSTARTALSGSADDSTARTAASNAQSSANNALSGSANDSTARGLVTAQYDVWGVGSVVFGRPADNTEYSVGATVGGGNFYVCDTNSTYNTDTSSWTSGSAYRQTLVGYGSWRCISHAPGYSSTGYPGTWVRYA